MDELSMEDNYRTGTASSQFAAFLVTIENTRGNPSITSLVLATSMKAAVEKVFYLSSTSDFQSISAIIVGCQHIILDGNVTSGDYKLRHIQYKANGMGGVDPVVAHEE
jgi:hypothetical protein